MATRATRLLTAEDAAALVERQTGVPVAARTIRNWIAEGVGGIRLPARRVGRRLRIAEADLKAFLRRTA